MCIPRRLDPKISVIAVIVVVQFSLSHSLVVHADQLGEARKTLAEAQLTALKVVDTGQRHNLLARITDLKARAGDLNGARETARLIPASFEDEKAMALNAIAEAYIERKEFERAFGLVRAMTPRWRNSALQALIIAEARAGRDGGAIRHLAKINDHGNWTLAAEEIARQHVKRGDIQAARSIILSVRSARLDKTGPSLRETMIETLFARLASFQARHATVKDALTTVAYFQKHSR